MSVRFRCFQALRTAIRCSEFKEGVSPVLTVSRAAPCASLPGAAFAPWRRATLASAGGHLAIVAATGLMVMPRFAPAPQPSTYTIIWAAAAQTLPRASATLSAKAMPSPAVPAPVPTKPPLPVPDASGRPALHRTSAPSRVRIPKPSRPAPSAGTAGENPERHERPAAEPSAAPRTPEVPAAPDDAWLAAFTARVQSAVQQAASYPMVARRSHAEGRVQVGFDYMAGVAADPAVLISSRTPALDRAAIAALVSARYPQPPAALAGNRVRLVVWVDFRMLPEDW